ncbi:MAG: dockerin type I repeat-containing protein [Clostridia bacterium]|nr:dockerin type I repeat-containing protein [Clostridia bacterium]
MKKLLCFVLALAVIASFATMFTVSAEETSPEGAEELKFVVDGKLDKYYRSDEWAIANHCYYYFEDDTDPNSMFVYSRDFNVGMGELVLPEFFEEVKVKIYAAYDDTYAYFFVDVDDPNIIDHKLNDDGTRNEFHQQMENIDFYIDTDPMSCTGHFYTNEGSDIDADTHFRLMAHNLAVTDTQGHNNKYIFADQPLLDPAGNKSADNYFKCSDNMVATKKFNRQGKQIGYTCEIRVPLAHNYEGYENYSSFYYNIAVTNSATEMDELAAAIAVGDRWWLAYDSGATVTYDTSKPNPFFYPADEDQNKADIVSALINDLTDPDEIELWEDYDVWEKIEAYEALTDRQKSLVDPAAYEKLKACARVLDIDWPKGALDQVQADLVIEKIDALPATEEITLDHKDAVSDARIAYNSLTDEQQALVTNLDKLVAAEAAIKELGPDVIFGDVDGDEKITATDALEVLKSVVGKTTFTDDQKVAADVTGDGKADAADALDILKKVVGKIDRFAVEA